MCELREHAVPADAKWDTRGHTGSPSATILAVSGVRDPQKYWNGKQPHLKLFFPPEGNRDPQGVS